MMHKLSKNNIILILLVLVLLTGGIYFYKNANKKAPISENENVLSLSENEDFKRAMNEAQKAFGRKEYDQSITYYNEALSYLESDKVYSGLYTVYSAQKDWDNVLDSLNKAINLNSLNADYWIWKLFVLDEQFKKVSFNDLSSIYDEAMNKIDPRLRTNLTINFARIAENNRQINKAISLWQKAKELSPIQAEVYEEEITRLQKI